MGGYERKPAPWALDGIPDGFEAQLLPEEWDRMEELFTNAIVRVPAMETAEVKKFFNGPEAFTPDADFLLGETDVPGFWVAAGGCAHGLAGAGGIGKVMGEWIVDGLPEWDVWPLDVRRFGRQYRSQAYTLARSYEALSQYYDIKYPGEEKQAGRPLRVSPAYARHQRARRRVRREGRLGARQLVRVERRRAATSRCVRAAGRARTGRRRSGSRHAPRERQRRSSTSRASRSSRCSGPARSRSSSGCARTGSIGRSAPSSTRSC